MLEEKVFTTGTLEGYSLQATLYQATQVETKAILLYFHGGGMIFGQRDDLPKEYLDLLTLAGYPLISFDYLLAPESKIDAIFASAQAGLDWYYTHQSNLGFTGQKQVIFGRSAGAFLSIRLTLAHLEQMAGLIAFYGYYDLADPVFKIPNNAALKQARVSLPVMKGLVQSHPLTSGPMALRYPLYLYVRQNGKWQDLMVDQAGQVTAYSLTEADLCRLPPTFLATALNDPDVPAQQSIRMSQVIPQATIQMINTEAHDFDRTHIQRFGLPTYQKMISWLDQQLS